MSTHISEKLLKNINIERKVSPSGSLLFFAQNYTAKQFCDLFNIEDKENFEKAFEVVTTGKGDESKKINSLHSSSLLSLLFFSPLFNNQKSTLTINFPWTEISGLCFTNCLFEVRNKVIHYPSCIDIVLISEDKKNLLFLESKLSEYETLTNKAEYGISYRALYEKLQRNARNLLSPLRYNERNSEKTTIEADEMCYIEGIKQSISHLVGLVKGPSDPQVKQDDPYLDYEYKEYKTLFKKAEHLYYGTILFDPVVLGINNSHLENYYELYEKIIGNNGSKIISIIKEVFKIQGEEKEITVLKTPLLYNNVSNEYLELLPKQVRNFYNL